MKNILSFLLIPILLFMVACSAADDTFEKNIRTFDKKPVNYPDALILLPNATAVKYYELGGSLQLTYKISAEYPAAKEMETISNQLKKSNWNDLKEDYLNPGIQTSLVRGWTSFEDETKKPTQTVNQWMANWENQAGEIITYWFFYRYDSGKTKDLKNLTVTGIFIPASLAKITLEEALKFHQKYNVEKIK